MIKNAYFAVTSLISVYVNFHTWKMIVHRFKTTDKELLAKTVEDIYKLKQELWNSLFKTKSLTNNNYQLP